MTYRRIPVDPLTPAIDAEISDIDLRGPLHDETYAEIRRALPERVRLVALLAQFGFGKGGGFGMIPLRINQWSIVL